MARWWGRETLTSGFPFQQVHILFCSEVCIPAQLDHGRVVGKGELDFWISFSTSIYSVLFRSLHTGSVRSWASGGGGRACLLNSVFNKNSILFRRLHTGSVGSWASGRGGRARLLDSIFNKYIYSVLFRSLHTAQLDHGRVVGEGPPSGFRF